ncbi:protein Skeletor, isoforms D/E-like [Anabrus simplex]|uniref:protein Skeletor, isoforms D/E-like n=1 Tax=Anabrus simplex TaxID=316456 RepID=UPI0035A32BAF
MSDGALGAQSNYYGKYIGKLKTLHHGVTGEVYAVDARTLHIRDFSYDGEGPAAYFYAGDSKSPNGFGFRVNDENGTPNVLSRYRKKHITVTLPDNKTLRDIKWFSVWCDEFSVNFGDVRIPKNLDFPKPQKIDALNGVHKVSSDNIVVVDAQTLLIPQFSYDGEAPDAKFWVGRGNKPSPQGVRVPDENGKEEPLRKYDHKTIVLTLPKDMTVYDIGHFGVWCEAFTVDFGHIRIPRNLNVPPSLKMLGVSPQSKLNCEVLQDEKAFEVRWAVAGDSVVFQLVGKVDEGDYMAFGLSGDNSSSAMIGGDVVVAWINHTTLAGSADDYHLADKSQCSGKTGSCPDDRLTKKTNNVRVLNVAMVNGYSIITYQRPLRASDKFDLPIWTTGSQPVIWAIGPLNSRYEVSYHHTVHRDDVFIDFTRSPKWNCPLPEVDNAYEETSVPSTPAPVSRRRPTRPSTTLNSEEVTVAPQRQTTSSSRRGTRPPATPAPAPKTGAWEIPPIQCYEPEDGVFYAQMGPTGGKHGYSAITGHVGWGISWYINGLLIPEINVVRGKTYTFVVEGGLDPETPARYHPFYITDDPIGGYEYKTPEERANVRVFAGVQQNRRGEVYPTGTGRLCNWTPNPDQPPADEFASFGAYQRTLTLECDEGEAGLVQWTPDENTPDTVYYQCYTHRYLGWKINVHDSCDSSDGASEPVAARLPAGQNAHEDEDGEDEELQSRPSIRVSTRVKPNGVFYTGDKGNSQDVKENIFKDFQKLPSNTQENFQQDFSFSLISNPESNENTKEEYKDNSDLLVPPSELQQYPSTLVQYIPLSDNTEPKSETYKEKETFLISQNNYNTSDSIPFKPSPPLHKDPELPLSSSHSQDGSQEQPQAELLQATTPSSLGHEQPSDLIVTPSSQPTQYSQADTSQQQFNNVLSSADPMRTPVIHATTPHSVLPQNTEPNDVKLLSDSPVPSQSLDTDNDPKETDNGMQETPDKNMTESDVLKSNSEVQTTIMNPPVLAYKRPLSHRPHGLAPHGYVMPNGRPGPYSAHSQMMFMRPQGYSFRRPIPHRGYTHMHRPVTASTMFRHTYMSTPVPSTYVMTSKKPFFRVTHMGPPHRTMVSPAPYHRPMTTVGMRTTPAMIPTQQQYASTFKNMQYSLPPQRLNHDRLQTRFISTTSEPEIKYSETKKSELTNKSGLVSPAPLVSTSEEPSRLNMPIAVNTGFHPESVVVEGGFKPIVPKTFAAQDRSSVESEPESDVENATHELKALEDMEREIIAELTKEGTEKEERKDNPFEGQQPESFEPMFIPSPPDRIVGQQNGSKLANKKSGVIAEGLIPPAASLNHRNSIQTSRVPGQPLARPRPGAVRRPAYSDNVPPAFRVPIRAGSPSFRHKQIADDAQDETPMAAERMDTYYLPPADYSLDEQQGNPPNVEAQIPPGAVITYDGKPVVDVSLASSISDPSMGSTSFQSPSGTADLIKGTPQFGPYRGEVPPPVPSVVRPESIPQLQNHNKQHAQTIPPQFPQPLRSSVHHTQLSLVGRDDLVPAGSEVKELVHPIKRSKVKGFSTKDKHKAVIHQSDADRKESLDEIEFIDPVNIKRVLTEEDSQTKYRSVREKRSPSPHHEPGHDDHDHSHHNHHDMHSSNHTMLDNGVASPISALCLLLSSTATLLTLY